jgi:ABC-type arginine/histidine transport system permease subunit
MFDFSLLISSFPRLLAALPVTLELFVAIVLVGLIVARSVAHRRSCNCSFSITDSDSFLLFDTP